VYWYIVTLLLISFKEKHFTREKNVKKSLKDFSADRVKINKIDTNLDTDCLFIFTRSCPCDAVGRAVA
jgi:hypothetical protein